MDKVYAVLWGSGSSIMGVHLTPEAAHRQIANSQTGGWGDNEWSVEEYPITPLPDHDTPAWTVTLVQSEKEPRVERADWPLEHPGHVGGNQKSWSPWWSVSVYAPDQQAASEIGLAEIAEYRACH